MADPSELAARCLQASHTAKIMALGLSLNVEPVEGSQNLRVDVSDHPGRAGMKAWILSPDVDNPGLWWTEGVDTSFPLGEMLAQIAGALISMEEFGSVNPDGSLKDRDNGSVL